MEQCSKCRTREVRAAGQRYCRECHNASQRTNRPRHSDLSDEQRRRANARSYLNVYIRRGKVQRQPCRDCGAVEDIHGHHTDYSRPLDVIWLCRSCHVALHAVEP